MRQEPNAGGPMIWLPFDVSAVGEVPSELRFATVVPTTAEPVPATAAEVEFYVPPYRFADQDAAIMAHLPKLRVVQTLTAGVDHLRQHLPAGVTLCNGRGVHDASTAELAMALILASLRGIPDFVRAQAVGQWRHHTRPALADRTVLIVGYGQIGAAIEARLVPFEVDILRVARTPRDGVHGLADLSALVPQADVVVLIVPGTRATTHLVDADFLARMRDGALLVNVARGPVVHTGALLAELSTGRLHAALDVTDPEPLPAEHPLWRAPNCLISPHVGGASTAMEPRAYRLLRQQLARYARGDALVNVVVDDY
ncbi:MAG: 2-hydroxyacid dehydrogenase [Nocardioides sp.]